MQPDLVSDREAFVRSQDVSRETLHRLDRYVDLLLAWQAKTNLVAPSTLPRIWTRHVADSLQFEALAPEIDRWVDIGSGGGFPGLVTAIRLAERPGGHVDLVESTEKKAAFLRLVVRDLGLPARVHAMRIETADDVLSKADAVSARALASLDTLLGLVAGRLPPRNVPCYFAKGKSHQAEIAEASAHWRFSVVQHPSTIEPDSVILEVRDIVPRSEPIRR